jgi:hypothetical protein
MPTVTQPSALILTLDGTDVSCQVIDTTFVRPQRGAPTITETACAVDAFIAEPGALGTGSLTGTAFTDTTDEGLTWLLSEANDTGATIAYVLTMGTGATAGAKWTGTAVVNSETWPYAKPGLSRTPIDLVVLTAARTRPV